MGTEVVNTPDDPAVDHAIDTMLRERLGGEVAPDVVNRVLESSVRDRVRAARRAASVDRGVVPWAAAALLLVCVSVVVAIALLGPDSDVDDEQALVRPRNMAELLEHLGRAREVRAHIDFTLDPRRVPLASPPDAEGTDADDLARFPTEVLVAALRQAEPTDGAQRPENGPARLRVALPERRYIEVVCGHAAGRVFVRGLGSLAVPGRLDRRIAEFLQEVEMRRRMDLGVVFGATELAELPASIRERPRARIVGVDLTPADLELLTRRFPALKELDLSLSRELGFEGLFLLERSTELRLLRVAGGDIGEDRRSSLRTRLANCRIEFVDSH